MDFKHNSEIDTCVILDRSVDYVSALVTPLTYEALIDEMLGIENGAIYEDVKNLSETREERRKKSYLLLPRHHRKPLFDSTTTVRCIRKFVT